MNQKLSEYHTGYRAFSKEVLQKIKFQQNSDDFVFDNEMIAQIFYAGFEIAEVTCPTKYFDEASSINFARSTKYGLGVLRVSFLYFFSKIGLYKWKLVWAYKKIKLYTLDENSRTTLERVKKN